MSNEAAAPMPDTGTTTNEATNTVSEPIEISGGDNAVSFDDLEAVKALPEEGKQEKVSEKPAKESKDKEEKEDQKKETKESVKEKIAKEKSNAKLYKVKIGDKDVEVGADGKLSINVGGKDQEVTVQDLINSYHGSQEIHRRMTKIDLDRKSFESERKSFETVLSKINDLYRQDKPTDLLNFLVQEAGLDPDMYKLNLYEKLAPEIEEWNALTPEEKQYRKLQLENQALKRQQETVSKKQDSEKSYREIESKVQKIQNDYGLSNEAFFGLYQELVQKGVNENSITPEMVANYADHKTLTEFLGKKVQELAPKYEGSEELVSALMDELSTNNALDIDDIDDLIKSITQEEVDEQIEEKLKSTKKRSAPPSNPSSDPISWDDLT